jgi:DNA-directed RNA polymerase subunit beta'
MSTNNILSPANGKPIIVPSQDIVLGCTTCRWSRTASRAEGKLFANMGEIDAALDAKVVSLHTKIKARWTEMNAEGAVITKVIDTTPAG